MTITKIIEDLEKSIENVEEMTHIPEEIRNEIITSIETATESLEESAEEYGEDPEDATDVSQDDDLND